MALHDVATSPPLIHDPPPRSLGSDRFMKVEALSRVNMPPSVVLLMIAALALLPTPPAHWRRLLWPPTRPTKPLVVVWLAFAAHKLVAMDAPTHARMSSMLPWLES
jgi:hypothetical protein